MDEGALGVHKEHVRDPDLLHQPAVKRHALVVGAGEGEPLVFPVVSQVERHGEVLQQTGSCHSLCPISIAMISLLWYTLHGTKLFLRVWVCFFTYFKGIPHVSDDKLKHKYL